MISKRYERGSVIITSNKVFEEWAKIFYDLVLATAILDRFVHHCHFVVIKSKSYRMKQREDVIKSMSEENPKKN
ncbi:ATP-binding protein [Thermoanaerobacterium sp. RBIITD]|uniref:ATP-binding protein n=1 Tax=Thermoanaerobacterium sp. RBIITD TaxID=1550240 RepID=UPI0033139576